MANCKSCAANIIWVTMPSGKKMPVDIERVKFGNVEVSGDEGRYVPPTMVEMHKSHFVTCSRSDYHRKKLPPPRRIAKGQTLKGQRAERERLMYQAAREGRL